MAGEATDFLNGIINSESRYDRIKWNPNIYADGKGREISHKGIILDCYGVLLGEGFKEESPGCFWEGLSPLIWMARGKDTDGAIYDVAREALDIFFKGYSDRSFASLDSGICVPLYRAVGNGLVVKLNLPEGKFMEGID